MFYNSKILLFFFFREKIKNFIEISYRKCISECTHTLIDEIWSSLLDQLENSTIHLIIIQLISSLLNGYRLFDLNIPRDILIRQNQLKYDRTLDKLRQQINETMVIKGEKADPGGSQDPMESDGIHVSEVSTIFE